MFVAGGCVRTRRHVQSAARVSISFFLVCGMVPLVVNCSTANVQSTSGMSTSTGDMSADGSSLGDGSSSLGDGNNPDVAGNPAEGDIMYLRGAVIGPKADGLIHGPPR